MKNLIYNLIVIGIGILLIAIGICFETYIESECINSTNKICERIWK